MLRGEREYVHNLEFHQTPLCRNLPKEQHSQESEVASPSLELSHETASWKKKHFPQANRPAGVKKLKPTLFAAAGSSFPQEEIAITVNPDKPMEGPK